MVYVYLIESVLHREIHYVGIAHDLRQRLADHTAGRSVHTAKFKPWRLIMYAGFAEEASARAFEKYLKSGSGRTFLKRHFLRTGPLSQLPAAMPL